MVDGPWLMTSWLAAAGLTTMLPEEVEATPLAFVVKLMFIVSALLYDRPLNVATPLENVTVRVLPWSAAVPCKPRVAVTVWVLSVVMTLPN